jgi:hypothetical protein
MYDKKLYPKGVWTDCSYQRHKIADLGIGYLWNIVMFITRNLPYEKKSAQGFWRKKRMEILTRLDALSRRGRYRFEMPEL